MKRFANCLPFFLLFLIIGCMVEEPGEPKWEVELTIPIADKIYSFEDILADSENVDLTGDFFTYNGDTLFMNLSDSIERVSLEDELTQDEIHDLVVAYVGIRTVNSPGSTTDTMQVIDNDYYPVLPPMPFGPIEKPLPALDEFEWVELASGDVSVTITNHLPVALTNLQVDVRNDDPDQELVVEIDVTSTLLPGEFTTVTSPLPTGVRILNTLKALISGQTGSSSDSVTITDDNNYIQIDVDLGELEVVRALAHIPAQSFEEDSTYAIEDTDSIRLATIREGNLTYTIHNHSNVYTDVTFTLPDISLEGMAFGAIHTMEPRSSFTESLDLAGYELYRENQDNLIQAQTAIEILDTDYPPYPNPGEYQEIDSTHNVETEFWIDNVFFSRIEGYLDNRVIEYQNQPLYTENIPAGLDSIQVESAVMELYLSNTVGTPLVVDLILDAYRFGSLKASYFAYGMPVPQGDGQNPGILDTTLLGLEPIVETLPDYVISHGQAYVSGQVYLEDWQGVEGKYKICAPFALEVLANSRMKSDITTVSDGYDNPLREVEMILQLVNHTPLDGEAYLLASYDSLAFDNLSSATVDTFLQGDLPNSILDENGYVSIPGESEVINVLDRYQLEMYAGADEDNPVYFLTIVILHSTNGQKVRIKPTDNLIVGAIARVLIEINPENGDEWEGGH
jgi:hypothetical protein